MKEVIFTGNIKCSQVKTNNKSLQNYVITMEKKIYRNSETPKIARVNYWVLNGKQRPRG